jgi:glycerophosphoryl diester phosphodiesterase
VRRIALAVAVAALAAAAPAQAKVTAIHAHRGGTFVAGKATYAEESLAAYTASARRRFVLEVDARVLPGGTVLALHDDSLDRTTACAGKLAETTVERIAQCPIDVLGSPGSALGSKKASTDEQIPRLSEVLGIAKARDVKVNLELKDFDGDNSRATKVLDAVAASGFKSSRLIVQSFLPPNLDLARKRLPGAKISRLSLKKFNEDALKAAIAAKDDYVSPEWPVSASYVKRAHAKKLRVVPFTLDRKAQIVAAAKAGVDEVITNDPVMAQRALR